MKLLDKAEITNFRGIYKGIVNHEEKNLYVKIPHYQRPYKWTPEQIEKLFEDYRRNKEMSGDPNYFVGSIVTVKEDDKDFHDIIDGQQRITTVYLLNYLKFLLLRVYTLEEISFGRTGTVDTLMTKLEKTYYPYIGCNNIDKIKNLHDELLKKNDAKDGAKNEDERNQIIENMKIMYMEGMNLPVNILDDIDAYHESAVKGLKKFLSIDNLSLRYARTHYNNKLKEALSSVSIIYSESRSPIFHIQEVGSTDIDHNIQTYIIALQNEFYEVERLTQEDATPKVKCQQMIQCLDDIIDSLKFCIISTCNYEDAYTLFEVLNDRALAIEDIDLIKNMLFRTYCQQSDDTEDEKDKNIQKLDELWGNDIFSNGISVNQSKLIQLLGTSYLTGDSSIMYNEDSRFRKSIQDNYLSKVYPNGTNYNFVNIFNDISVYQMIKEITNYVKLKYNNVYPVAVKAEWEIDKSITYKTIHLLYALNMKGVLAALTNQIIREFMEKYVQGSTVEVSMNQYRSYIERLMTDKNNSDSEFENIHITAFELWKCALLSKSAELPRKIAKTYIEKVNAKKHEMEHVILDTQDYEQAKKELKEWTDAWRYNASKQRDFKIRVFMLNLCKTSKKDDTELEYGPGHFTVADSETIQLDHLEANHPVKDHISEYFMPVDDRDDRNNYVDSLGNFMILDGTDNNAKDNKPLYNALSFYEHMGQHWLIDELTEMINNPSYSKVGPGNIRIPKEEFFNERKNRLQSYFLAVASRKFKEKKVEIKPV